MFSPAAASVWRNAVSRNTAQPRAARARRSGFPLRQGQLSPTGLGVDHVVTNSVSLQVLSPQSAIPQPATRQAPRREGMSDKNQPRLAIKNQAARFSQARGLKQHRHRPANAQPAHRPSTPATPMAPFEPSGSLQQVRRPTSSRFHRQLMKLHGTKVPAFPASRLQDGHRGECRGSPHHPITSPHAWSCGDS